MNTKLKNLSLMTLIILTCVFTAFTQESMMMSSSESTAEGAGAMMMADSTPQVIGGKVDFTDLKAAGVLAAKGPVVLFFYATWCPTCRVAIEDINANLDQLGDVTVVIVDYDKNSDLKTKYKITYQHTFVQIDEKSNKLAVWNGGGVGNILKNIVRAEEE